MTVTPWPASWEDSLSDVVDIALFLLDRLDEDQREAENAARHWSMLVEQAPALLRWHLERRTPDRVLADVAAKRDIVMRFRLMMDAESGETRSSESIRLEQLVLAEMVRRLAAVYADHPNYLDEWRRA